MAQLTFAQIEDLWITNGGNPGWAPLAAGIAIAESGGNTAAHNTDANTGDNSVGLWQINYFGNLAPSRTAAYGSPTALLGSPDAQAKAAISLSGNGANWQPWQSDAAWKAWQNAGAPSMPNSTTVESWVGSGAGSTAADLSSTSSSGSAGGGSTAADLSSTSSSGSAGGGQGGAPYTPSIVPGIPSAAPAFPDFTLNPYNELSRVLSWTSEFGGWAIFTLIVLLFGILLLMLGLVILVVLLAKPITDPVADVVGGGIIGRMTKRTTSTATSSSAAPAVRSAASTVPDETSRARHASRGRHAAGSANRPQARELVRNANADQRAEERFQMGEADKADRRNLRLVGPQGGRGRSVDRAPKVVHISRTRAG
jgi:hypothetical protein